MEEKRKRRFFTLTTAIALGVILIIGVVALNDDIRLMARGEDRPPEVDFTWSPIGKVTLLEMVGHIRIEDDYALDFSTLAVRIVELDRVLEIVRPDVIGREYESDVHFGLLHEHPVLLKYGRMTLDISIADDRGQVTRIERVVKLKTPEGFIGTLEVPFEE